MADKLYLNWLDISKFYCNSFEGINGNKHKPPQVKYCGICEHFDSAANLCRKQIFKVISQQDLFEGKLCFEIDKAVYRLWALDIKGKRNFIAMCENCFMKFPDKLLARCNICGQIICQYCIGNYGSLIACAECDELVCADCRGFSKTTGIDYCQTHMRKE